MNVFFEQDKGNAYYGGRNERTDCKRPAYVEFTPTVGVALFIAILNIMNSIKKEAGNLLPKVFTFNTYNQQVRVISVDDQPYFIAKDLCDSLDLSNPSVAIQSLDEDERAKYYLGRQGETWCVNESGLYHLIFQSRKPEAKKFRKWVTAEVLPSIRKTGRYEVAANRKLLPRERSAEMAEFYDELTQWVLPKDIKAVAEMKGVGVRHVQKVLRGSNTGYDVLCELVEYGKYNRRRGIRRKVLTRRAEEVEQLRLEFMSDVNGRAELW